MPFMVGPSPIRRTVKYLNAGLIHFRDKVRIFSVNYNKADQPESHHVGTQEFIYWHLPQIQYWNPTVQCATFKFLTPSPFIRIFLEDGSDVFIDCDSRSKDEILDHLQNFTAICKTKEEIKMAEETQVNPNHFGYHCTRQCMCEITGQVPCPVLVPTPYHMRTAARILVGKRYKVQ